jgi:hypothetical protein
MKCKKCNRQSVKHEYCTYHYLLNRAKEDLEVKRIRKQQEAEEMQDLKC